MGQSTPNLFEFEFKAFSFKAVQMDGISRLRMWIISLPFFLFSFPEFMHPSGTTCN